MENPVKKEGFLDDVLNGRIVLPMVPKVIQRLLNLIKEDNCNPLQLVIELEKDPILSSKVLRLANTSYFGGRRSVGSINDAVHLIGTNALHTLIISCGAQAMFIEVPGVNLRQFWHASTITAYSARQLAIYFKVDKDTAYCAGLLQSVGHLILCQFHQNIAQREFSSIKKLYGVDLAERENEIFGVNHAQVSAIWVSKLGMPNEIVNAIEHSLESDTNETNIFGKIVNMSCNFAKTTSECTTLEESIENVDHALQSQAFTIDKA